MATNVQDSGVRPTETVDYEQDCELLMQVPEPLRRWLQYEAGDPYNIAQMFEIRNEFKLPWSAIWRELRKSNHDIQADAYKDRTLLHRDPMVDEQIRELEAVERKTVRQFRSTDDWWSSKSF